MSDNPGLDGIISDQIDTYLTDPSQFPEEFLNWLPQFLSVNAPALQNSDLQGGTLTPVDGAPHYVAWGSGTVTFSSSANSGVDSRLHGLGGSPAVVFAISINSGIWMTAFGDPTHVNIQGFYLSALSGTFAYAWLAIL